MRFAGTPRPRVRWSHASSELRDFAIVSYRVEPDRLQRALPAGFEVEQFHGDDGQVWGLISAVPFLDHAFHYRWMPLVKLDCGQVNYRAYVRHGGERGVWFFGTSLDTWLVAWPRLRWKMPWYRDRVRIDAAWNGPALRSWALSADGDWGRARCTLGPLDQPVARVDGFRDRDHLSEVLCHPLIGWYPRRDRGIGRYTVWHEVLDPIACRVDDVSFQVFEDLDLVTSGAAPHSAFVQREIHFDVHTPPVRVKGLLGP